MPRNKSTSKEELPPRPTSYKKNITREDVIEIINAIRRRPLLWVPNTRKSQKNYHNQKTCSAAERKRAWNDVLNELTNKTVTLDQLKVKWTEYREKYFKVKKSDAKALKKWHFASYLKFLNKIDKNPGKPLTAPKSTKKKQKPKPAEEPDNYDSENSVSEDPLAISIAEEKSVHSTPKSKPSVGKRSHVEEKSVHSIKKSSRSVGKTSLAEENSVDSTSRSIRSNGVTSTEVQNLPTTEASLSNIDSTSDVIKHPNSTLCEYLLAELHSLAEDKSRHLRRLLMQTVYDFVDYPDS